MTPCFMKELVLKRALSLLCVKIGWPCRGFLRETLRAGSDRHGGLLLRDRRIRNARTRARVRWWFGTRFGTRTFIQSAAAGFLLLILAGAAPAWAQTPEQARVVWGENPGREATISWSTRGAGTTHEVHYDTVSRNGQVPGYRFTATQVNSGSYNGGSFSYHHAPVTGLDPSTRYYFVLVSDGAISSEYHFTTAPVDARPFKILYGGDSRSDRNNRRAMNRVIADLVAGDPEIIGFVHGGDYIATGSSLSQWDNWLSDYQDTITADGQITPIIPTRGNHEGNGVLYNTVFAWPGGPDVDYFSTVLGSYVLWITLDSNSSMAGNQRTWLEAQLVWGQSNVVWIMPSYHRPAYPAVKSPGGALEHFVPLFEQYRVDVVCESDGHVLKRTVPILKGAMNPDGVTYVGEGGLGVSQRTPQNEWYFEPPGMTARGHHVQLLSFSPQRLGYEARMIDGQVVDQTTFDPRRVIQPPPPVDGGIPNPDGGLLIPDGGLLIPDGGTGNPDGGITDPRVNPSSPSSRRLGTAIGSSCNAVRGGDVAPLVLLLLLIGSRRRLSRRVRRSCG